MPQIVEIEKQIIVPVEVPIVNEKIIEKVILATEVIEKPIPVPQVIEKVVPQKVEVYQTVEVPRV